MTTTTSDQAVNKVGTGQVRPKWRTRGLQIFLLVTALVWLAPLIWAFYTSLRPFEETFIRGYFSFGGEYNLDNYSQAWQDAEMLKYFINTLIITVPAVFITLLFSSAAAFALSRFSFRFNLILLMLFTAGNLLPQQVIITPLYRMFLLIPLPEWLSSGGLMYDSYMGIIAIHVAFQMGFCTFVLSNYMKALPGDLNEAAFVDGASVWRQYWSIILPLARPPLAALGTLQFTWIYNDFFWALVLMTTGAKRPITSALQNLNGTFFTNNNLIAAGSLLAAIPTLLIFMVLQRQFVAGLTLGSTKG
jgi:multiple sugar transport system permease protein